MLIKINVASAFDCDILAPSVKTNINMTKKHFIKFAEKIKAMPDRNSAAIVAKLVAEVAMSDNPRFDCERFMSACGF